MIEYLVNFIFLMTNYWTRSRDPFLNEYRGHVRRVIVNTIMTLFMLGAAVFISPTDEMVQGVEVILYPLKQYLSLSFFVVSILSCLATIWSCVLLYLFIRENGSYE